MDLRFRHIHCGQLPAAGLLVVSIGSLGHLLHPVVLEVGVAGVLCAADEQDKAVVPFLQKAEPPHHIVFVHVPGLHQRLIRHLTEIRDGLLGYDLIQIRHSIRHHGGEQFFFAAVALVERAGGYIGVLANSFQRCLFKALLQKLPARACQDQRVKGMVRLGHCLSSPQMIIKLSII